MNRLTTSLSAAILSITASGCALLRDPAGSLADASMAGAVNAFSSNQEVEQRCSPLAKREIAFDEEHALGGALALHWVSRGGGLTGADAAGPFPKGNAREAQVALNVVGRNLAFQSARPHLPWTFGIVESEGFNAISAPAGYIFVTRGLLEKVGNEAELAGVLAHEIAHITLKHALTEYQKAMHAECKRSGTAEAFSDAATRELRGAMSSSLFSSDAIRRMSGGSLDFNKLDAQTRALFKNVTSGLLKTLFDRGYSADDEFAADLIAAELMAQAGYDPEAYVGFLGQLPEGDRNLSTAHPKKAERQKRLRQALAAAKAEADDDSALLPFTALAQQKGPLPAPLATLNASKGTQQAGPASP